MKKKKRFYKKYWFWLIIILIVLLIHPYFVNLFIKSSNNKVNHLCNIDSDCIGKYMGDHKIPFEDYACFNKNSNIIPIKDYNPLNILSRTMEPNIPPPGICNCENNFCVSAID